MIPVDQQGRQLLAAERLKVLQRSAAPAAPGRSTGAGAVRRWAGRRLVAGGARLAGAEKPCLPPFPSALRPS